MKEATFIIGLPGSGKSTLIEYYKTHPIINYIIFDDWMLKTVDSFSKTDFRREVRYEEYILIIIPKIVVITLNIEKKKMGDIGLNQMKTEIQCFMVLFLMIYHYID